MRYCSLLLLCFLGSFSLSGQMERGGVLLYGNEWIEADQEYYEIKIATDGIYRIENDQMQSAGIPIGTISLSELQLWHNGQQVPILVTDEHIEFVGYKNRIALDTFLLEGGKEDLLNHEYGLINDTSYYYLSWAEGSSSNKRMISYDSTLNTTDAPESFVWKEQQKVFSEGWSKPYSKISGANIYMSNFERGEGFASELKHSYNEQIELEDAYLAGPNGTLSLRFSGDYDPHVFSFTLNGQEIYRQSSPSFALMALDFSLDTSILAEPIDFNLQGHIDNRDRFQISHTKLKYPAQPELPDNGKRTGTTENDFPYFEIMTSDETQWYHYDLLHHIRYAFAHENGLQKVYAGESPNAHDFIWLNSDNIQTVNTIEKVSFRQWDAVLASDYIILTSERLHDEEIQNPVEQYAEYRSTDQGGAYTPSIVRVEDIYRSFGYGINRHPQSIRNFAHYIKANNPNHPSIFIIGKGREYSYTRTPDELADPLHDSYYVPTFGYPSSDNLLFADKGEAAPMFPLGRLSIESKEEIQKYLDKVKAQEEPVGIPTYENSYWHKKVVHLVGGGEIAPLLNTYMDNMANSINGKPWNPEINKYTRESNQSTEKPVTDIVFDEINSGVGLVTFFGHSANNSLGFDINIPSKYDNAPRHPFLIALGCYGGNINTPNKSVGEIYSSFEGGGFIGSIATSSLGEVSQLYLFAQELYKQFGENAGKFKMGPMISAALQNRQNFDRRHSQQIMYYGDPALRLFQADGPDYTFNQNNIQISPTPLEAGVDSFILDLELVNLGTHALDSIKVDLSRTAENAIADQQLTKYIQLDRTSHVISVKWPTGNEDYNGKNTLFASIDPENNLEEFPKPTAENNNHLMVGAEEGYDFYILSNGIEPGWPFNFSIVGKEEIKLKGVTTNPLAEESSYLFEIDTISNFSSPFKKQKVIQNIGGVIEWAPDIKWETEKVYYWRTAIQASDGKDTIWNEASFVYIPEKEGWNQSHVGQYIQSDSIFLSVKGKSLELPEEALSITIKNLPKGGNESPFFLANGINVGSVNRTWNFVPEGIGIAVIDTIIFTLQKNRGSGLYNSVNQGGQSSAFVFKTNTTEERSYAINFIENIIPDNSDVFIYTIFDNELMGDSLQIDEWAGDTTELGTSLIKVLEERGAKVIDELVGQSRQVYNFFYHQYPDRYEPLEEDFLFSTADNITNTEVIGRRLPEGYFLTPIIDLKNEAATFSLSYKKINEEDSIHIQAFNDSSNLFSFHRSDTITLDPSQTNIENSFQLFTNFIDPELRSILDLHHIRFYQSEKIDLCWAPNYTLKKKDSLHLGEAIDFNSAIIPLNYKPDGQSLNVQITISTKSQIKLDTIFPVQWNDSLYFVDFSYKSSGLTDGKYTLSAVINPNKEVIEKNYQNNTLLHVFNIINKQIPPVLTTKFDGRFINNGEVISSKPTISIELYDYNAKSPIDTSIIEYKTEQPDGSLYSWHNDEVSYHFMTDSTFQKVKLILKPQLEQTGYYNFSTKYFKDRELGVSAVNYTTQFQIINSREISYATLFPNPVHNDQVFLSYKILGNKPPKSFEILFYNTAGKNVYSYKEEMQFSIGESVSEGFTISPNLPSGIYFYEIYFYNEKGRRFIQSQEHFPNKGILNVIK